MNGLETIVRRNNRAASGQGLWCRVADMDGGRWFAGDVIDVEKRGHSGFLLWMRACLIAIVKKTRMSPFPLA
jgi:hypothetical protein